MIGTFDRLTGLSEEAVVCYHRRLEETMVIIRWIAALLCLLILLLVPPPFLLLGTLVTAGLAVGNLAMIVCLRHAYRPRCYLLIGGISSALEWFEALGMILAWSTTAFDPLPAALIVLLVIDGVRYGLAGVVGAWVAAALGVGTVTILQMRMLHVIRPAAGTVILAHWEIIILTAAIVLGLFLRVGQDWLRQEQRRWEAERASLRQQLHDVEEHWHTDHAILQKFRLEISPRMWEVLTLLAQGLTDSQIAERLSIEEETVRTHLHHLADKLKLSHGHRQRSEILAAARERGLLPPEEYANAPEARLRHSQRR